MKDVLKLFLALRVLIKFSMVPSSEAFLGRATRTAVIDIYGTKLGVIQESHGQCPYRKVGPLLIVADANTSIALLIDLCRSG
jgi:hypothetical protein